MADESRIRGKIPSWGLLAPAIVVLIFFGSVLIVKLVPPGVTFQSNNSWPGITGFSDSPDKIVLVFWLVVLAISWLFVLRPKNEIPTSSPHDLPHNYWILYGVAVILLYVTLSPPDSTMAFWSGLNPILLMVCQLLAIALLQLMNQFSKFNKISNIGFVIMAGIFFLGSGFQTPSHVRDAYHTTIVVNDILAQTANQFPLGNATTTYTTLLGWPLRWVLQLSPALEPVTAAIWYLLFLQVITIAIALKLVLTRETRGKWGLIVFIALAWTVFDPNQSGQSALQSFAINPARTLLPIITISLLINTYRNQQSFSRMSTKLFFVGLLASLSAINNLEFGLTVWASAFVTILVARSSQVSALRRVIFFLLGSIGSIFLTLLVLMLHGQWVHFEWLIRVPLIYAGAGIDLLPMPSVGLHIYFVALFIVSSMYGLKVVRSSVEFSHERYLGFVLLLVGTWSSLSLIYFSGRSVSAALIAGYSLQVGILSASLFVLCVRRLTRHSSFSWNFSRMSMALWVTLPLAVSLSLYVVGTDPRKTLAWALSAGPISTELGFGEWDTTNAGGKSRLEFISQSIFPANIRAITTGIPSTSSTPEVFLPYSKALGEIECTADRNPQFWIVEQETANKLLSLETCRAVWMQSPLKGITSDGRNFTILERLSSSPGIFSR